jgi:hypothetical protein
MRPGPADVSETVVPFAPVRAERFSNDDPLDQAGQSITRYAGRATIRVLNRQVEFTPKVGAGPVM